MHSSNSVEADLQHALELAQRALALDDSCSSALGLLSRVNWMLRRFDQALNDAQRAVAIDPNYAEGYGDLSMALEVSGKSEAGISAAESAMRLDPVGRDFYESLVGIGNLQMGRQQDAIWFLKEHLVTYPNDLIAHLDLIVAYEELGRDQDARAEIPDVMRINPSFVLPPPEISWFKDVALNKRWEGELRKAGLK
jgi:adenylate cyclase